MRNYFLFLPQLALAALYDWIFFVNEYSAYPAERWWAFAFLHATLLAEIVFVCFLRRMKQMPLIKKQPMWLFTTVFALQFLLTVVFSLVSAITLKWVIILSSAVLAIHLLLFGILLLVQKRRDKKERGDEDSSEVIEPEPQPEPELPEPPKKIKSSSMLLLLKFLSDPGSWEVPADFAVMKELTDAASSSKQYTYEELSDIEAKLKEHTNALKTFIKNKSMQRAESTALAIIDLLKEREDKIFEVESYWAFP